MKKSQGSTAVDGIATILKLFIVSVIFFQMSLYGISIARVNIGVDRLISRATLEGGFEYKSIKKELDRAGLLSGNIVDISTSPLIGERATRLGEPMSITIRVSHNVELGSLWSIEVPIVATKQGVNEAYYGEGYMDY